MLTSVSKMTLRGWSQISQIDCCQISERTPAGEELGALSVEEPCPEASQRARAAVGRAAQRDHESARRRIESGGNDLSEWAGVRSKGVQPPDGGQAARGRKFNDGCSVIEFQPSTRQLGTAQPGHLGRMQFTRGAGYRERVECSFPRLRVPGEQVRRSGVSASRRQLPGRLQSLKCFL